MNESVGPARLLSRFAAEAEDIPAAVCAEAVRSLVNHFGCAIAGSRARETLALLDVLRAQYAGGGGAVVAHPGLALPWPEAAFLNAVMSNVHDFDDTHQRTVIHPTAPVAPALFAVAGMRPVGGPDLLDAFAVGVEVACRIGNAMSPEHYRHGWHITASCGIFGAAAGVGRLLGLDAVGIHHALGIAAGQAAGLVENLPYGAKNVGVGNAARNGLLSALMAQAGIDGPPDALGGRFGFFNVIGPLTEPAALTEGLGESWELLVNDYKPWPVGVVLNPVIDACLVLRERLGDDAGRIASITVTGHPLLAERTDRAVLNGANDTRLSSHHVAAICFLRGNPGLGDFTEAALNDPALAAFRGRVRVEATETIAVGSARVSVALEGGGSETVEIEHARGSRQRPLSDDDLDSKFRTLTAGNAAGIDGEALLSVLRALGTCEDVAPVLRLAAGAAWTLGFRPRRPGPSAAPVHPLPAR